MQTRLYYPHHNKVHSSLQNYQKRQNQHPTSFPIPHISNDYLLNHNHRSDLNSIPIPTPHLISSHPNHIIIQPQIQPCTYHTFLYTSVPIPSPYQAHPCTVASAQRYNSLYIDSPINLYLLHTHIPNTYMRNAIAPHKPISWVRPPFP